MIEHEFPYESFIGGWYIPEKICDDIVNYFNEQKLKGKVNLGMTGNFGKTGVITDVKDSEDLEISSNNFSYPFNEYRNYIQVCLENYIKKYYKINDLLRFSINSDYNIQYYKKGGGFKVYHCERTGQNNVLRRVLVFMTYLNNVDDGGTEFYYQKITSPAKKGLTMIWPTDWTHTHKGQISYTKEKIIITGWYTFDE